MEQRPPQRPSGRFETTIRALGKVTLRGLDNSLHSNLGRIAVAGGTLNLAWQSFHSEYFPGTTEYAKGIGLIGVALVAIKAVPPAYRALRESLGRLGDSMGEGK